MGDKLVDHLIIVAKEGWGNTDFLELSRLAHMNGVHVHFIGMRSSRSLYFKPDIIEINEKSNIKFSILASKEINNIYNKYKDNKITIHVRYYKLCSIIGIILSKKKKDIVIDIRSSSIKPTKITRTIENYLIGIEMKSFLRRTVISPSVASIIGINRDFIELPLGAPSRFLDINRPNNDISKLRYVYIGTLRQRNIHIFASAFAKFVSLNNILWEFDIYGSGNDDDIKLIEIVTENNTSINYKGYLDRENFPGVLQNTDIAVSYIPLTEYFNHQPPTKTYEYMMAGVPVLGTRTAANMEIIKNDSGWLCGDDEKSIMDSLEMILKEGGRKYIDRSRMEYSTWEYIFNNIYRKEVLLRGNLDELSE